MKLSKTNTNLSDAVCCTKTRRSSQLCTYLNSRRQSVASFASPRLESSSHACWRAWSTFKRLLKFQIMFILLWVTYNGSKIRRFSTKVFATEEIWSLSANGPLMEYSPRRTFWSVSSSLSPINGDCPNKSTSKFETTISFGKKWTHTC